MDQEAIREFIATTLTGVDVQVASKDDGSPEIAWGDTFFFYNPDPGSRDRRMPFATIVTKDYGDFDAVSNLDRAGVFRLNIGLDRETFKARFGGDTKRSDFTALDEVMPHPIYSRQSWVCVLNPSRATMEQLRPLLQAAHALAVRRHENRETEGSAW